MRFILSLLVGLLLTSCGDDDANVGEDGGAAGVGGSEPGDGDGDGDGDGERDVDGGGSDEDGGSSCTSDDDCTDNLVCTGVERCVDGSCRAGKPKRCSPDHPCVEAAGGCACSEPNLDGDRFDARACGGKDCDDSDPNIHPAAMEECGPGTEDVDEDCDPARIQNEATQDGDADQDGQVSALCVNVDPDTGDEFRGTDCDDKDDATYEGADEQCDIADNDCDGAIDEGQLDGMGPVVPHGLSIPFYPDADRDGYGNHDSESRRRCEDFPPLGFVPRDRPHDCDDTNVDINISETELCDGVDNDCDELIDVADDNEQPLLKPIEFTDTTVECKVPDGELKPRWIITDCPGDPGDPDELLWCSGIVELGCTTEATSLENCRACDNECTFACGRTDCDEVVDLSLGADHSCARTREGVVACWGFGLEGRIGNGESSSRATPTELLRIPQASAIGAGDDASCAVLGAAREVHCWGSNADAVLANSDIDDTFSPYPVPVTGFDAPTLDGIERVAVGAKHACAVRETGELYCWGQAENGRLGNETFLPDRVDFAVEVLRAGGQPVVDADSVAVGGAHSCIVTDESGVDCWGDNTDGQLGDPDFTDAFAVIAQPVPDVTDVDQVVAGAKHTCVLSGGEVLCWGANFSFQLGRQSTAQDNVPMVVDGLGTIAKLAAGHQFTCALDMDGAVWCWGSNGAGELGNPELVDTPEPQRIAIDDPVTTLSAGQLHACAVTATKTYCWGDNRNGQLGLGQSSFEGVTMPEAIRSLDR